MEPVRHQYWFEKEFDLQKFIFSAEHLSHEQETFALLWMGTICVALSFLNSYTCRVIKYLSPKECTLLKSDSPQRICYPTPRTANRGNQEISFASLQVIDDVFLTTSTLVILKNLQRLFLITKQNRSHYVWPYIGVVYMQVFLQVQQRC